MASTSCEAEKGLEWSDMIYSADANEWLLFHASIPEAREERRPTAAAYGSIQGGFPCIVFIDVLLLL